MIYQGTTPCIKVVISGYFPWNDITALELAVAAEGGTKILLSKEDVTYNEETITPATGEAYVVKALYISLSQKQTFAISGTTAVQLRYLVNTGAVYGSNIAPFIVFGSISDKILGTDALTSTGGVIARAEITVADEALPVNISIQEGGGSAPYNDILEITPNNPVSESIEVGVKKSQSVKNWITDILVTKVAPIITLAQKTATFIQGEAYAASYLSVACSVAKGTGNITEVKVDGVALTPVSTSFNVTYPSSNISAGSVNQNKTIQVTAKASDGKEATPQSLAVTWVYKVGVTVEGGTTREVNYGSGTVTADNKKWIYISVPTSKGEVKLENGGFTYVAESSTTETRHNLPYTKYAFKHETTAAATYTIKYA